MKIIKWIGVILVVINILFFGLSMSVGTEPKSGFMSNELIELESYFIHRDVSNTTISQVDIAWQLDHILKAIINITQTLEDSNPDDYKLNFNVARTFIFTYGDFPRGVAQAPASVTPPDLITNEALIDQLNLAREKVVLIKSLHPSTSLHHNEFGLLNRDQAARLIEVHTEHHLKIIRDILEMEGIETP